jgi:hypothetical protein
VYISLVTDWIVAVLGIIEERVWEIKWVEVEDRDALPEGRVLLGGLVEPDTEEGAADLLDAISSWTSRYGGSGDDEMK